MLKVPSLFSYRKYWASRFGIAPYLPMSLAEMDALGWDSCDIVLVTGDAYVDHPSFGMAVIGRVLEAQGFRVGIIAQPDWSSADDFQRLGRPNLFFGVTGGNMDSMVNRYTSDRKVRSNDAYTPNGEGGKRPDRSVLVYSQRCREAYKDVPLIIGGIEASLRRIAHFDYWSEKVRRSVLMDAKADLLVFGNAERQIIEIAHRLAKGEDVAAMHNIRGTACLLKEIPATYVEIDYSELPESNDDPHRVNGKDGTQRIQFTPRKLAAIDRSKVCIRMPSYEAVKSDKVLYGHASRILHLETNPGNARALVQRHGQREVWINPPPIPLASKELDAVFELPFTRQPHPAYQGKNIPAYEMIRFSINIMRGCFGGCTFCSITEHEGRIIQSRSDASIIKEIETIRDTVPGFTGVISDLGGPTANMYRLACKDVAIESACRKLSCVYPDICSNLNTDHDPLIRLYRRARELPGIKKILIASGLRYDLAVESPKYVEELVSHHVGGYLKIAPEHTEIGPLEKMMKPGMGSYYQFKELFEKFSKKANKEQYLIPYFIAAHPGTTVNHMIDLAVWLKQNGFRADQVQNFLPSPMATASAMYYSEKNPLRKVNSSSENVFIAKGHKQRSLHKAFLRYHDPENWPLLRDALKKEGRSDLIGNGKKHLIPLFQPAGTGKKYRGELSLVTQGKKSVSKKARAFKTQHSGEIPQARKKKIKRRAGRHDNRK